MADTNGERGVTIRPSMGLRSFRDIWEDMDRFWEGFPTFRRLRPLIGEPPFPPIDMYECENSVVLKADLPGISPKDIDITVNEDSITISGERSEEKEVKETDYYRSERSYGRFMRQVPLPSGVDRDKIQATFKDGVLEAVLPLKEGSKQKRIEVKAA